MVDGQTAERLALVHWSVPDAELAAIAGKMVTRIAGLSVAALSASKRCIAAAVADIRTGLLLERLETLRLLDVSDTRQRVRAFLEK
jgi:hypothetical protein